MMRTLFLFLIIACTFESPAQVAKIPVHDPVVIRQDSVYYLFATGRGISTWSSIDRINWVRGKAVFDTLPWGVEAVTGFKNHIWAPDISFHDGLYFLYYSVSTFGKNNSCIGVATNPTLHPNDPRYQWTDHGKVIQSIPGRDHWNAIDPNLISDENGNAFLAFGSFWDGLKIVPLTKNRLALAKPEEKAITIASRKEDEASPGSNAIEAPFIFRKNKYYYLFASIDLCCKGENSTYKMIVGRSTSVTGPYLDINGKSLAKGGGSILLQGDKYWHGVGHNAVIEVDGVDYLVFHGYDAADRGRSKLRIERLEWDTEGWPMVSRKDAKDR
ncbi:MAG: family 43 glycosylhydrolase [Chitinophagaceae bacterium]|nr:family 43 glycosylhydrolase [Chitinophagaceae bacterium]